MREESPGLSCGLCTIQKMERAEQARKDGGEEQLGVGGESQWICDQSPGGKFRERRNVR